jgi:hypothetical protein
MAAADEAARPIPKMPKKKGSRGGTPGTAKSMPTMAVKSISATTLGLQRVR